MSKTRLIYIGMAALALLTVISTIILYPDVAPHIAPTGITFYYYLLGSAPLALCILIVLASIKRKWLMAIAAALLIALMSYCAGFIGEKSDCPECRPHASAPVSSRIASNTQLANLPNL